MIFSFPIKQLFLDLRSISLPEATWLFYDSTHAVHLVPLLVFSLLGSSNHTFSMKTVACDFTENRKMIEKQKKNPWSWNILLISFVSSLQVFLSKCPLLIKILICWVEIRVKIVWFLLRNSLILHNSIWNPSMCHWKLLLCFDRISKSWRRAQQIWSFSSTHTHIDTATFPNARLWKVRVEISSYFLLKITKQLGIIRRQKWSFLNRQVNDNLCKKIFSFGYFFFLLFNLNQQLFQGARLNFKIF